MNVTRWLLLTLGPIGLVGSAYAVVFPTRTAAPPDVAVVESVEDGAVPLDPLGQACQETARQLADELGPGHACLVRPPFVLAGDLTLTELEHQESQTIRPVLEALRQSYLTQLPDQPVTIVLLSSERSYRATARRLNGTSATAYYGYYDRNARRLVANLSTGDGTLAHELTHALTQFDFPGMPEWFDEGLASLHEESEFTDDGRLWGRDNWRRPLLVAALRQDRLPPLSSVITAEQFRTEGEGLNYALVRYFCLYLQERELLIPFYRAFREQHADDPAGSATLCTLLGRESLAEIDADFAGWLANRSRPAAAPSSP